MGSKTEPKFKKWQLVCRTRPPEETVLVTDIRWSTVCDGWEYQTENGRKVEWVYESYLVSREEAVAARLREETATSRDSSNG